MKLLILTQIVDKTDAALGFFHQWIEAFSKHCESVIVICLYEGEHDFPSNVRVLSLGKEKGYSRWAYIRSFYSYIYKEKANYDAVFVHMNQIYILLGGLLWKVWKKPVSLWYAHKSVTRSLRLASYITQHIFTSTENSFRIQTSKKRVIGHGIDTNLFAPQKEKKNNIFTILSVGRITRIKDYESLIAAVNLLKEKKYISKTNLWGGTATPDDAVYLNDLHRELQEKELETDITLCGPALHSNEPQILSTAHVFAHMSKTGSLDKTVLEAMAVGIPIVSCNESVAEIIPESLYDICMFREGDIKDFSEKIETFYHMTQEKRDQVGKEVRDVVVRRHNLSKLVATIIKTLTV